MVARSSVNTEYVTTEFSLSPQPSRRRLLATTCFVVSLLFAVATFGGCERMPTMTSGETMRLLTAMRTACSAKSPEHLEEVRQKVEEARQDKRLSDAEYEKLTEIIATANAGNWEAAEQACFRFQKANSG